MIITIIIALLLLLGTVAAAIGFFKRIPEPLLGGVLAVVVGVVIAAFACTTVVPTREIGIKTTFGRPSGELGNGFHVIAPWEDVTNMDGAIQLQSFQAKSFNEPESAIKVRLGNNSSAYVDMNLNWRLKPEAAPQMFQDYRTFDNIRQNLVDKQAQVALSKEFATFDPTAQAQGTDFPGMASRVKEDLQNAVGKDIEVLDVRIPGIFYDQGTQDRIDQHNQKVQETKNAAQDVETATQQRLASEQRANQAAPDLKVAIFNCLNDQVKAGKDPAGCWGQVGSNSQALISVPAH